MPSCGAPGPRRWQRTRIVSFGCLLKLTCQLDDVRRNPIEGALPYKCRLCLLPMKLFSRKASSTGTRCRCVHALRSPSRHMDSAQRGLAGALRRTNEISASTNLGGKVFAETLRHEHCTPRARPHQRLSINLHARLGPTPSDVTFHACRSARLRHSESHGLRSTRLFDENDRRAAMRGLAEGEGRLRMGDHQRVISPVPH